MTCIIGIISDSVTYVGCDSLASDGEIKTIVKYPKIFQHGNAIIGVAGYPIYRQVIEHFTNPIEIEDEQSLESYLIKRFVPELKQVFEEQKLFSNGDVSIQGTNLLVAAAGELCCIETNFQVVSSIENYLVVGSGEPLALGAIYALQHVLRNPNPRRLINLALDAASYYSVDVEKPYYILEMENKENVIGE